MAQYDYIIAGGGAAGLSLAYYISQSSLSRARVAIVDREQKKQNDRTWCFWSGEYTPFDRIIHRRWPTVRFCGGGRELNIDCSPYEYRMIRGIDFYEHTQSVLSGFPGIEFIYGSVDEVRDGESEATVVVDGTPMTAEWVFDSLFLPKEFSVDTSRYHFLLQHFRGWFIRTDEPVFSPDRATLFDFRTPQLGSMRFVYLLPFSPHQGLVEYTLFSDRLLEPEEYRERLDEYIRSVLGCSSYEIEDEEDGIIPMTDAPFPRAGGKRIMYTGTKGGMVKASTGFAFRRTQKDSMAIVESLEREGHPFHGQQAPGRYATFDSLLLQLLLRRGELAERIFTDLFGNNPIDRLFRFLDEEGTLGENLKLMSTVPWFPFIGAWLKLKLRGKV
jgi:lycopene beta-cyclase